MLKLKVNKKCHVNKDITYDSVWKIGRALNIKNM